MTADTCVIGGDILRAVSDSDPTAARIRQVLAARGWSERDLALRAGLKSESHVSLILRRGTRRTSSETLRKIAAGAGVRLEWLLSGDLPMDESAVAEELHGSAPSDDDPHMANRTGFDGALAGAKMLRPNYPGYVWDAVAQSDPMAVLPLSPAMLADLADLLAKYVTPRAADIPRPDPAPRRPKAPRSS